MNPIRDDLKAFIDGELTESRMEEVRAAIESDPALKQEVEELRFLGLEIKRLATEPSVVGKERVLDKLRRPEAPWWDASRLSGRLAYTAGLFFVLAGVGAVLFPVFAQSKAASKATAARSAAKQEAFRREMAAEETPATSMPSEGLAGPGGGNGMGGAGGGFGGAGQDNDSAPAFGDGGISQNGIGSGTVRGRFGLDSSNGTEKLPVSEHRFKDAGGAAGEEGRKDDSLLNGNVYAEVEQPPASPTLKGATGKERTKSTNARRTQPQRDKSQSAKAWNPPPSSAPAPASTRMVIKNADVHLKVDDAAAALTEAESLAKSLGGYVEGGNLTKVENQTPRATVVLRVRASAYEVAMKALRGMGEMLSEATNAEDVTAQSADVVGRLSVLRAEADSYVTMLRGAKKIGELMEIKDRLSQVRQELASLESQRKALQNESALSTIRATFEQKSSVEEAKKPDKSGFDETWAKAQNGLSKVGEFLGNLAIYLFVLSPVWLPPVVLFWWLTKKAKKA